MVEPSGRQGVLRKYLRTVCLDVFHGLRAVARLLQDQSDPRGRPVEANDIYFYALLLCFRSKGAPPVAECLVLGEFDELVLLGGVKDTEILDPEERPLFYSA